MGHKIKDCQKRIKGGDGGEGGQGWGARARFTWAGTGTGTGTGQNVCKLGAGKDFFIHVNRGGQGWGVV